jgi:predicted nucleotidyltransferase
MKDLQPIIIMAAIAALLLFYVIMKCLVDIFYMPISEKDVYKKELKELAAKLFLVKDASDKIKYGTIINKFEQKWAKVNEYFKNKSAADADNVRHQLYVYYDENVLSKINAIEQNFSFM